MQLAPRVLSDLVRAALCVALLVAIFLAPAWLRYPTHSYTAADLTQDYALTSLGDSAHSVGNRLLGDPVVEMQPWLLFDRAELRSGRLPLWNPYNGAGVPQFANFQSAVFSPFSLPFYLFSFKAALLLSAALKLFALGIFAYLFLRELELGFLASVGGASAFMFSGNCVLLLAYPHAAVTAVLPAGLYFAERAVRAVEQGGPRSRLVWSAVGVALSLAVGVYAGHPEPLVFAALVIASWSVWRLVELTLDARRRGLELRPIAVLACTLLGAALCAAALGAPQAATFLEYLRHSVTAEHRQMMSQPSLVEWWPLSIFPDAVGAPRPGVLIAADVPAPNYEQVNGSYAGACALMLAALGVLRARVDRRARFFALLALGWLALTSNVAGLGRAWDASPFLGLYVPLARSQAAWLFAVAVLAAFALEAAVAPRTSKRARVVGAGAAVLALVLLWAARERAHELLETYLPRVEEKFRADVAERIGFEERWLAASFVCAIALAASWPWIASARVRRVIGALLIALEFAQTGALLRNYNPTTEDRFVYPVTDAIRTLQERVGDARLVVLGDNGLPPHSNLPYRLATLQTYDALGVERYESLYARNFDAVGNWRNVRHATIKGLRLFGVEYLLTPGEWTPVGTELGAAQWNRDANYEPVCLHAGMQVEQSFVCERNGLCEVSLFASTLRYARRNDSDLRVRLIDESGTVVAEAAIGAAELRRDALSEREIAFGWTPFAPTRGVRGKSVVLHFEKISASRGRRFRLVVDCAHGEGQESTIVWRSKHVKLAQGTFRIDSAVEEATLCFDYRCGADPFQSVGRAGPFELQRYASGLGRFFAVGSAWKVAHKYQAFDLLDDPRFDPYRAVAIESDPETPRPDVEERRARVAAALAAGRTETLEPEPVQPQFVGNANEIEPAVRAEVVEETPTRIQLRVKRAKPGYLVACQTYFPGWRATVNGEERKVLCANFAFSAVELPPGTSDVVLTYAPRSLALGAWIALGGAVCGASAAFVALRGARAPASAG